MKTNGASKVSLAAVAASSILVVACSGYVDGTDLTNDELAEDTAPYLGKGDPWYEAGFNKTVPFCWCARVGCNSSGAVIGSSSALTNLKQWTQESIQETWGRSGLTITWTDPCPTTGEYVLIEPIATSALGGGFGIGNGIKKAWGSRSGYLPYHSSFSEARVKALAIHEIGHAMDLYHTQQRSDGPSFCQGGSSDNRFTIFDGLSVMATDSDCRGGLSRQGSPPHIVGLTGLDLAGFQMYYGFPGPFKKTSRNFCTSSVESLYTGDFDGDGRTDLLCNNRSSGVMHIEAASNGFAGPSDWISDRDFCIGSSDAIHVGDFDGNGSDDLLCLHHATGLVEIDLSNSSGHFTGVNWSDDLDFCTGSTNSLVVGNFNGDTKADLLCNSRSSGNMRIDYWESTEYFAGADWTHAGRNFCVSSDERLRVGDFDGDGKDDLLCENRVNGALRIDLAADTFNDTDFYQSARAFCDSDETLLVADMSGDGRTDIVCWNRTTGKIKIDVGDAEGFFDDARPDGNIWPKALGPLAEFCVGSGVDLHLGQFDSNGKADFLCHGNDLKVEFSQLTLPRLYYQTSIGVGADYESAPINVPSGSYFQASIVDNIKHEDYNVDLTVFGAFGPVCSSERLNSFEVCEVNGPGDFFIVAQNMGPNPVPVTVQAYVMPGSHM